MTIYEESYDRKSDTKECLKEIRLTAKNKEEGKQLIVILDKIKFLLKRLKDECHQPDWDDHEEELPCSVKSCTWWNKLYEQNCSTTTEDGGSYIIHCTDFKPEKVIQK